jgi:hypothetical protein
MPSRQKMTVPLFLLDDLFIVRWNSRLPEANGYFNVLTNLAGHATISLDASMPWAKEHNEFLEKSRVFSFFLIHRHINNGAGSSKRKNSLDSWLACEGSAMRTKPMNPKPRTAPFNISEDRSPLPR